MKLTTHGNPHRQTSLTAGKDRFYFNNLKTNNMQTDQQSQTDKMKPAQTVTTYNLTEQDIKDAIVAKMNHGKKKNLVTAGEVTLSADADKDYLPHNFSAVITHVVKS